MLLPFLSDTKSANIFTEEQHVSKKISAKEDRCVKNNNPKLEWILPESYRVSDVFSEESLNEVPDF